MCTGHSDLRGVVELVASLPASRAHDRYTSPSISSSRAQPIRRPSNPDLTVCGRDPPLSHKLALRHECPAGPSRWRRSGQSSLPSHRRDLCDTISVARTAQLVLAAACRPISIAQWPIVRVHQLLRNHRRDPEQNTGWELGTHCWDPRFRGQEGRSPAELCDER